MKPIIFLNKPNIKQRKLHTSSLGTFLNSSMNEFFSASTVINLYLKSGIILLIDVVLAGVKSFFHAWQPT